MKSTNVQRISFQVDLYFEPGEIDRAALTDRVLLQVAREALNVGATVGLLKEGERHDESKIVYRKSA